jgi:Mg2+ and Co2+ transporter CorA
MILTPSGVASAAGSRRQEMPVASTISQISPTRCQARTRLYRDGRLELEGFPVADISEYLAEGSVTIWLDLRDSMEELEDRLFNDVPRGLQVQRRSFQLRKSLVLLRRIVIPMSEVAGQLTRPDLHIAGDDLMPYYRDTYEKALRAAEWTEGLRDREADGNLAFA